MKNSRIREFFYSLKNLIYNNGKDLRGMKVEKNSLKLLASRAVNKLGDVLYDYGNSSWIASMGSFGQKMLGIYQSVEVLIAIILNPFGGAIADRFRRRKILLWTDGLCALLCVILAFIPSNRLMLYGLILANMLLAVSNAFSNPAYRAYVPEVVKKEKLVSYNSYLETSVQIIKVSSPLLGFLIYHYFGIRWTLIVDSLTFGISFLCLLMIRHVDYVGHEIRQNLTFREILKDIWEGFLYIVAQKEIFFLLIMATTVNLFLAMLTYLLPFSSSIFKMSSAYATLLSLSAVGSIFGAIVSKRVPNTISALLWALGFSGLGITVLAISPLTGLPIFLSFSGVLFYSLFETIFNIHFFSQVQSRVANEYMGRVISSIYTLAILFMPLGTLVMTLIRSSISAYSFIIIGLAVFLLAMVGLCYSNKRLKLSHEKEG